MELGKKNMVCKCAVAIVGAATIAFAALADTPDTLYFVTGNSLSSGDVLSTDADKPTTVFEGVSLSDYEPAYIYFAPGSSSGSKYYVCPDLHNEILRPYFVARDTEDDAATMTVQYQGVTRTKATPYTASITIKFKQNGDDIEAYVVRAASLKPFDVELGLDVNALVDAQNPRAIERPLSSSGREAFNTSVITMRKPGAAVEYTVHEGDTVSGTLAGNGAVTVTKAAADEATIDETVEGTVNGYMPAETKFRIPNHSLVDLDAVEGTFHVHFDGGKNIRQAPYNLKYSITYAGQKTCQFQYDTGSMIACLVVQFLQDGDDVVATIQNQWRGYYISKSGYEGEVMLGMDFEKYSTSTTPKRNGYSAIGTSDTASSLGVKDLKLKFRSRARTIWNNGFFPNGGSWVVVAPNQQLSALTQVDGYFHRRSGNNQWQTAYNLKYSILTSSDYAGRKTCQFQYDNGSRIECLLMTFRQNGSDVEAYTSQYRTFTISKSGYESEVVLGMDFEYYDGSTTPSRATWNVYATDDSQDRLGVRNLHLIFNSTGITYTAASTAPYGNSLTFSGSEGAPLDVKTTAATTFPSNGVVTVNPYTTLTLSGHVKNPIWTQYRVMTNGVLKLKGTWQTHDDEQIDLVGGTLSVREDETVSDSGTYVNYLTLMDGAVVRGKPVRIGRNGTNPNWVVAGNEASECETGLILTARASDSRYIAFNVNDVANGSDFLVAGDITDYNTFTTDSGYWDVHVVKDGAGTMEVAGCVTLPNEIDIKGGTLKLAKSSTFGVSRKRTEDGSNAKAAIWLSGGALETVAGATNTIGAVVAKAKDAQVNLGNGSKLTLASFSRDTGASLLVSDNLGNGADICIESERLNVGKVIRGVHCGDRFTCAKVGEDGCLYPYKPGMAILIK